MKKYLFFMFICINISLFLAGCNFRYDQNISNLESSIPHLEFSVITGYWKELGKHTKNDTYKYLENFHNKKESTKFQALTFDNIAKQLENTEYKIEYGENNGKVGLGYGIASYLWELYKNGELIWTGNDVGGFQKDGNHVLICSLDKNIIGGTYCIIDGKYELIGYNINGINSFPKIYNGDIYKVKITDGAGEHFEKYGVFKNDKLLYTFEAEFAVDSAITNFFVDDNGRRLYYKTIILDENGENVSGTKYYLIHNGQDVGELGGYGELIGLGKIGDRTVYFYKNDGKVWYNLNGVDFKTSFSEIEHDKCCEGGYFNISFVDEGILFYAKQKGKYSLIRGKILDRDL